MAKSPERVERFSKSYNEHKEIYLRQIAISKKDAYCHRDAKELEDEKLAPLAASLVREGQATPFSVYETGQHIRINEADLPVYGLNGGHRRFHSMKSAIASRLDESVFHDDMKVPVVVMVRGEGQSDADYIRDVLVRSVTENEQRLKHSALERLDIVCQFERNGVPIPRAASALGISISQYRRDRLVAITKWLHDAVVREEIGASHAAKLAESAKDNDREKELKEDFLAWVREKQVQLEEEREQQKKLGRELKGPANTIKKYLDNGTLKAWLSCLKAKRRFAGSPSEFNFGVVVDDAKKTVNVTGVNQPIDKMQSQDVAAMIAEMQAGVRRLVPVMKSLQLREQAVAVSDDEIEEELVRLQDRAREAAMRKELEDAGRDPAPDAADEDVPVEELGTVIDVALSNIPTRSGVVPTNAETESANSKHLSDPDHYLELATADGGAESAPPETGHEPQDASALPEKDGSDQDANVAADSVDDTANDHDAVSGESENEARS